MENIHGLHLGFIILFEWSNLLSVYVCTHALTYVDMVMTRISLLGEKKQVGKVIAKYSLEHFPPFCGNFKTFCFLCSSINYPLLPCILFCLAKLWAIFNIPDHWLGFSVQIRKQLNPPNIHFPFFFSSSISTSLCLPFNAGLKQFIIAYMDVYIFINSYKEYTCVCLCKCIHMYLLHIKHT